MGNSIIENQNELRYIPFPITKEWVCKRINEQYDYIFDVCISSRTEKRKIELVHSATVIACNLTAMVPELDVICLIAFKAIELANRLRMRQVERSKPKPLYKNGGVLTNKETEVIIKKFRP